MNRKPIKIFLQDGSNDLNIYAGDWWKANETMERALVFAGYDVQHVWGEGAHNGQTGYFGFSTSNALVMERLACPCESGIFKEPVFKRYINSRVKTGNWLAKVIHLQKAPTVNAKGEAFYQDIPNSKTYKVTVDRQTYHACH
jgi:hypothetical protein